MASYETIKIENIRIGERFRKDLGDIADLADSIREIGLLHPVVITMAGWLVAGQRRIEAFRKLGLEEIPVVYASRVDQAVALIKAERDENRCRLDMTPSEYVALGRALEAMEAPKAAARRKSGQDKGRANRYGKSLVEGQPTPDQQRPSGKTTELVASALGVSGTQYKRARSLVEAADGGDAKAAEAVQEMDTTGIVSSAYFKYKGQDKPRATRRGGSSVRGTYTLGSASGASSVNSSLGKQKGVLERGINNLEGTVILGLSSIDDLRPGYDKAEITRWSKSIKKSIKILRQLDKKLTEYSR